MANNLLDYNKDGDLFNTLDPNKKDENPNEVETTEGILNKTQANPGELQHGELYLGRPATSPVGKLTANQIGKPTVGPVDPVDKSTVDPNLTVEDRMAGLLSGESKYLNAARSKAMRTANQRGLLNTSMAAGAGEKAAIESAMPIATQDAAYFQGSAGKTQEARLQSGLYEKQGEISKDIATHEGGIARELEAIVQQGANFRQQAELEMKKVLAAMELGNNERTAYAGAVSDMGDRFMAELNNIQRDPNVTTEAKTAAIATLQQAYRQNLQTISSIYGVSIEWEGLPGYTAEDEAEGEAAGTPNPFTLDPEEEKKRKARDKAYADDVGGGD